MWIALIPLFSRSSNILLKLYKIISMFIKTLKKRIKAYKTTFKQHT